NLRGSYQSSWIPVGANLFAKALFQTQKMHRLHLPLREQVRPRLRPESKADVYNDECSASAVRLR
ncbi:hypothetical protein EGU77_19795, partial [Pseudomonas syringae pv. theae]|nr:hypothetical protein [Pseudomonas syringae pv. theae]